MRLRCLLPVILALSTLGVALQIDQENTGIAEVGEEEFYAGCEPTVATIGAILALAPPEELPSPEVARLNVRMECLTLRRAWRDLGYLGSRQTWGTFWNSEAAAYASLPHLPRGSLEFWASEIPEMHVLLTAADIASAGVASPRLQEGPRIWAAHLNASAMELAEIKGRCEFSPSYLSQYILRARDFPLVSEAYIEGLLKTACWLLKGNTRVTGADLLDTLAKQSDFFALAMSN